MRSRRGNGLQAGGAKRLMVIRWFRRASGAKARRCGATFIPCSPSGIAQPRMTRNFLGVRPGTRAERFLDSERGKIIGACARSEPCSTRDGGGTAETMTASGMGTSQVEIRSLCWREWGKSNSRDSPCRRWSSVVS